MTDSNKSANAGVHGSTGYEFQKHCALHILFDKYAKLQNRAYFICLEHHDDVLFCYQTQTQLVQSIAAYQAKKSSGQWGMGKDLATILKKLTQVGLDLLQDDIQKDDGYTHELSFLTNGTIKLNCHKKRNGQSVLINDANPEVQYVNLPAAIKARILQELHEEAVTDQGQIDQLTNLSVAFIDLPKQAKKQKDTLIGQFQRLFGNLVHDSPAAVDTLLTLFRQVENTLNLGNVARLLDVSKRVSSDDIKRAMNLITTKSKAYEFWRSKGDDMAQKLQVGVFDREKFKLQFENSFDLFKDLGQREHQKLLKFARENKARWDLHTNEVDCINDMFRSYVAEVSTNLNEFDIKAAISAAYLELKG